MISVLQHVTTCNLKHAKVTGLISVFILSFKRKEKKKIENETTDCKKKKMYEFTEDCNT